VKTAVALLTVGQFLCLRLVGLEINCLKKIKSSEILMTGIAQNNKLDRDK